MGVRPQALGREYEAEFAERHGLKAMPASGAGPRYKLDAGDVDVLFSLKLTTAESFRITAKDLLELQSGAAGPGGRGQLGIMVSKIEGIGEEVATMRWSDLLAVLRGEVAVAQRTTPHEKKLAGADPLAYLRESE